MPFAALGVMEIDSDLSFQRSSPIGRLPTCPIPDNHCPEVDSEPRRTAPTGRSEAVTGGAMDRVVERKRIDRRILFGGAAAAVLLLLILFLAVRSARRLAHRVARPAVHRNGAESGTFDDFLPLRGAGDAARHRLPRCGRGRPSRQEAGRGRRAGDRRVSCSRFSPMPNCNSRRSRSRPRSSSSLTTCAARNLR